MTLQLELLAVLPALAGCCLNVATGSGLESGTAGNGTSVSAGSSTGGTSSGTTGSTTAGTTSGGSLPCQVPANWPNTVVTTVAGNGMAGFADGSGGRNGTAQFNYPSGIAVDRNGNLYVADSSNFRVRRVDPAGNTTTIAGDGTAATQDGTGGADGTAEFTFPFALTIDAVGSIFVVDDRRIRRIAAKGNVATLPCTESQSIAFNDLFGIALDGAGNIVVTDGINNRICSVDPLGMTAITLAGNDGGNADFGQPIGLAFDAPGNLYVGGNETNVVTKIDPAGQVTTLAGNGVVGFADGPGLTAEFNEPGGVAVDPAGNLVITDCDNRIRRIDPAGNVTTIAGNGQAGDADGTGGPQGTAEFNCPVGVAIDSACNLYVAGNRDNRIRKITFGPLPP